MSCWSNVAVVSSETGFVLVSFVASVSCVEAGREYWEQLATIAYMYHHGVANCYEAHIAMEGGGWCCRLCSWQHSFCSQSCPECREMQSQLVVLRGLSVPRSLEAMGVY